jgi:hypothetical protein
MAIAELPADARLIGNFEGDTVPRDLTGWLADLLVMGYHSLQRKAEGMPDPAPEEQVQVGELTLTVPFEAGNFVIIAPSAQMTYVLTPEQTLELLYRGVGDTITAGVAHDVVTESLGA